MRLKIRVYNPYDLDIIALCETKGFSVGDAMRQTLRYYAMGKKYLVEIPVLPESVENSNYTRGFYVDLDDEKDANTIEFIKAIPDGLRNSFLKNIFRASFEVAPVSLYFDKGGSKYVSGLISNRIYGKYPVQREIVEPVDLGENEVSASVYDSEPDINSLPKFRSEKPKQQKSSGNVKEDLRDVTKSIYEKAEQKKKEEIEKREAFLNPPKKENNKKDDEMDSLLDSMM